MSNYDFQRLNEYSLIDKRFAYTPRKRVPYNGRSGTSEEDLSTTHVMINGNSDSNHDDPEYMDLLKEYEADTDTWEEREKELQMLRSQANLRPLLSQGATYLVLLACISAFVLIVNWYNVKQLAQLKEEYGLDERMPAPEFWWRKSLIYHIYVHSYQDSDGDGIGDLNGIRQRVDHLVYLGVDAVLLSSFYDTPFEQLGHDIRDHKAIGTKYGSMHDFENLVNELHKHGIKVLVEVIPNHTSRRHKWFMKSRLGGLNNEFKNYYLWDKGTFLANGTRIPVNNWVSRFGGPAWTFDDERQEYYYHYYHSSMPDLNVRDDGVRAEILEIFRFWLDKGVDALYVDGVHVLYESDDLELDEPMTENDVLPGDYQSVRHIYTESQPDVHDFLGHWRDFIENYSLQSGRRIGLLVNTGNSAVTDAVKYYFTGPDAPVAPSLLKIDASTGGQRLHELVDSWLAHLPEDHDAIWMLSSPDVHRVSSRKGPKFQSALNMLSLLLPGAMVSYYGDEIGLEDTHPDELETINYAPYLKEKNKECLNRLSSRMPMSWSADRHAGFTTSDHPWVPVHASYPAVNVETQKMDPTGRSPVQIFHRLAHLRKERSFLSTKIQFLVIHEDVLSFLRFARDSAPYMIALNFGNQPATDDYSIQAGVAHGKVVLYYGKDSSIKDGSLISLSQLTLEPGDGIIVMLVAEDEFGSP